MDRQECRIGQDQCHTIDQQRAHVLLKDGTRLGFGSRGELVERVDAFENMQRLSYRTFGSAPSLPLPIQLEADGHALVVEYDVDAAAPLPRVKGASLVFRDPQGTPTALFRIVLDAEGYLTDICAAGERPSRLNVNPGPLGQLSACLGNERAVWRFSYSTASGSTSADKFLTAVEDDTGAVVERHSYTHDPVLGPVATETFGPSDHLSIAYTAGPTSRVDAATVTQYLKPANAPVGSLEAATVVSRTDIDSRFNRVKTVDGSCACGTGAQKSWEEDTVTRGPRLKSITRAGLETVVTRAPGSSSDPFKHGLPTALTFRDTTGQAPSRTESLEYQYPSGENRSSKRSGCAASSGRRSDGQVGRPREARRYTFASSA